MHIIHLLKSLLATPLNPFTHPFNPPPTSIPVPLYPLLLPLPPSTYQRSKCSPAINFTLNISRKLAKTPQKIANLWVYLRKYVHPAEWHTGGGRGGAAGSQRMGLAWEKLMKSKIWHPVCQDVKSSKLGF